MKDSSQPKTTRDALLDASDRLLARNGYKRMTIDALAREVGIGKGSVYLHFASKEEIALSNIDRLVDRVKKRLQSIAESPASPDVRLGEMLSERILVRFDNVQNYSQTLNELFSYLRPQLLERRRRYFAEESRILAVVIAEGQESAIFGKGNTFDLAQTMVTATNSLLPYSLSAIELCDRSEVSVRAHKLSELLIYGLMVR